jgi:hypothetical protein
MVETTKSYKVLLETAPLNHLTDERHKNWCAVVVLAAVCSLTASLATRYYSPWDASTHGVRTLQTNTSLDTKRQRLTKNAANWVPPVFSFDISQCPTFHPTIAPAGPPAPTLFFEESLYNRPPPASESL